MNRLLKLISKGDENAVRTLLLTKDIELNKQPVPSPLAFAAQLRFHRIARLLLLAGADPNFPYGAPLILAAQNNDVEMGKLLLCAGADLSIEDDCPARTAERYGHVEMSSWLVGMKQIVAAQGCV